MRCGAIRHEVLPARVYSRTKLRDPVRRYDELHPALAFAEHYDVSAILADIVDTSLLQRENPFRLLHVGATRGRLDSSDE
jgi:hypothetical protein